MSRRCWSWTRILVLLLSAKAASSTEPTSVPENLTAAAMANGEIAANAAAAAGATPQAIIENAANTAGIEAAYSAQVQSLSPPEVEAAAAQAAEGSAKMVGATPEEAATAGGKVAVQVAQKGTTGTTATAVADPYAMVPGTRCLNWWGDGCRSITNEDACKSSRDGSDRAMSDDGKKTFGQPCVWCAGQPCTANATLTSVCAPLITLPNPLPAGFETATCSGDETEKSSRLDWQQSVPDELRGGGYPRRDLNFEPVFNPGDEEKTGGRACRAKSTEDASCLYPTRRVPQMKCNPWSVLEHRPMALPLHLMQALLATSTLPAETGPRLRPSLQVPLAMAVIVAMAVLVLKLVTPAMAVMAMKLWVARRAKRPRLGTATTCSNCASGCSSTKLHGFKSLLTCSRIPRRLLGARHLPGPVRLDLSFVPYLA